MPLYNPPLPPDREPPTHVLEWDAAGLYRIKPLDRAPIPGLGYVALEESVGLICAEHGWCRSADTHEAAIRRHTVVYEIALEMNRRGVDFQPGQTWTAKRGPRRRTRRAS